jgi:hypothetical protein
VQEVRHHHGGHPQEQEPVEHLREQEEGRMAIRIPIYPKHTQDGTEEAHLGNPGNLIAVRCSFSVGILTTLTFNVRECPF